MEIGPLTNSGSVMNNDPEKRNRTVENNPGQTKDTIEISENARKKLAELADAALLKNGTGQVPAESDRPVGGDELTDRAELSGEVIDEIRKRIESGFYDSPEIKGRIVDRLIDDIDEE